MEKKFECLPVKRLHKTYEFPKFTLVLHLNARLPVLSSDLERPVSHVALDLGIIEFAANESSDVEYSVLRVRVT